MHQKNALSIPVLQELFLVRTLNSIIMETSSFYIQLHTIAAYLSSYHWLAWFTNDQLLIKIDTNRDTNKDTTDV